MKFRIMCTVHDCEVLTAAPLEEVPILSEANGDFEIAEDNLYCNFRDLDLNRGKDHNFRILPL